jgi:hypothetical protein
LLRKRRRFVVTGGKRANEASELRLGKRWRKVDAGDTRRDQQLRKIFFAGGGAERYTIEQNLITGGTQ